MDMSMGMDGSSSMDTPLSPSGVDFSNDTQANDFLGQLLDDSMLQITDNAYARYFWYGIVVVIGLAGLVNLFTITALKFRQREAAKGQPYPARPMNPFMRWAATFTAIFREASYPQLTPTKWPYVFNVPPLGTIILLSAYLAFVLALEFTNNNVAGAQYNTALSTRAAWLTVAQMPLLILLVGKNNLIGLFTGVSYERLNILHRWVARMTLLLATMHFGFQAYAWRQYHVFELEWTTDSCVPTGLATWVILLWMNLSTVAPLRNLLSYEFFVFQHIITFFGFIIAVMFHLPSTALYSRVYIYIPIALYLIDRIIRTVHYAIVNRTVSRATLIKLEGDVTRVRIHKPQIKKWTPGSHILVSFPSVGLTQSHHPATIASTPRSHNGDMILLLKSKKGFTKQLMSHANDSATALLAPEGLSEQKTHRVLIDGPYGGKQPDFAAFDSVCLIAGSTGVTFTLAILLDIAERAEQSQGRLPVRRLHMIWCIKQPSHALWIQTEQASAMAKLRKAGIESEVSFYVTCADGFTTKGEEKECPCACDKSLGPCCCINPDGDDDKPLDIVGPLMNKPVSSTRSSAGSSAEQITGLGDSEKGVSSSANQVDSEAVPSPSNTKAVVYSGRPDLGEIVEKVLSGATGESAIAVCGPLGLSKGVRNAVARASDRRAVHKGTGAQGVFLHVEGFGL